MIKQGVYIIPSDKEFLKVIDDLTDQYNAKNTNFIYIHKHLNRYVEVEKEIKQLNDFHLASFQGFKKDKLIKCSISDNMGVKYCITYSFNSSNGHGTYGKLYRYFRKRQQKFI